MKGTFTAPKDCLLYTSIPYNAGWSVYVDGKKVAKENIVQLADALLAIKVSEGDHEIEFSYSVPALKGGLAISLFTTLSVLAVVIFNMLLRKKKKKLRAFAAFPAENDFFSENVLLPAPKKDKPVEIIESVNLRLIDHTTEASGPKREIIKPPVKEIEKEVFRP